MSEQANHLLLRLQVALRVRIQPITCRMDRTFFPDTSNDVLQLAALRLMVMHIIGSDHSDLQLPTHSMNAKKSLGIQTMIQPGGGYSQLITKASRYSFTRFVNTVSNSNFRFS